MMMMMEHCPVGQALLGLVLLCLSLQTIKAQSCNGSRPNIVIMLMDDMGWGDLGANGEPSHETVHLDQMAQEGMLLTDFYAANPLCSPSRAALLTGRLPIRNGFYTTNTKARNSYVPQEMVGGISDEEILLPELLDTVGYRNKIVGKWHLGHSKPDYLPLKHGFHEFYGSPNCHFGPYDNKNIPNIPMFRNNKMIGRYFENIHIDKQQHLSNLTEQYTQEAIDFITRQSADGRPYFLYWTPDSLHAPTYRSASFVGKSRKQSSYGDALIEIDHAVGRILQTIRRIDRCNNTFVFFTSDNGAALVSRNDAGSNGPLLCGKQTTFEGGYREPSIAWWPGRIQPASVSGQVSSVMDLFRTVANLAAVSVPTNRTYDSNDLSTTLFSHKINPNASMFYYRGDTLMAVRNGPYKAHLWTFTNTWEQFNQGIDFCPGNELANVTTHKLTQHKSPVLFHVVRDAAERYPISPKTLEYQKAIKLLRSIVEEHRETLRPGQPVLNTCDRAAMNWQPPGCEEVNMCLPKPKSAPYRCVWPH